MMFSMMLFKLAVAVKWTVSRFSSEGFVFWKMQLLLKKLKPNDEH